MLFGVDLAQGNRQVPAIHLDMRSREACRGKVGTGFPGTTCI